MTENLPGSGGYLAAAYLVFFALVLIFFVIMAVKLSRLERELSELNERGAESDHKADKKAR